ncbi:MAG: hypothetical protein UY22_C0050G0012 [Candidatus Amesbacteria bacterium GW2011_GWC1_48_10]|uniref:Uncharacterized protein n=1 Tax=Candidatus Amesbacteria bacterium GW2011_GWC1_48_10 TaxID=1618365 RepID=A0A0G1U9D7_9BACT|nr:MAG: hypothetical protein UY22_C0050G0012 [Candidatus Amesbacteria bacterium GW2011_GWC1_48_10]
MVGAAVSPSFVFRSSSSAAALVKSAEDLSTKFTTTCMEATAFRRSPFSLYAAARL